MHLDSLLLLDGPVLLGKSSLSSLKFIHYAVISIREILLHLQLQQFLFEETLDDHCTSPQSQIFLTNGSHPPVCSDKGNCLYPPFFASERFFRLDVTPDSMRDVSKTTDQLHLAHSLLKT